MTPHEIHKMIADNAKLRAENARLRLELKSLVAECAASGWHEDNLADARAALAASE